MYLERISNLEGAARLAAEWNALARGVPFRTWEWLSCWWRHYGAGRELCVLALREESGVLVGLAPWYRDGAAGRPGTLRFLGCEEVCSEYLSVLCRPGSEVDVAAALAEALLAGGAPYLRRAGDRRAGIAETLELVALDARDDAALQLVDVLAAGGAWLHRRPGPVCWRLELPSTWEAYLALLSKSHRKQVRRLERRVLQNGAARLHTVETRADLQRGLEILFDLHLRRHAGSRQPGCFANGRFAAFHREAAAEMLAAGRLRLHWLELRGRPLAAEYHLAGDDTVYAYQSGIEPAALHLEPGHLITIATLRLAIEQRFRALDFLRGDEPYKAHWRALPRETFELRAAANHLGTQIRCRAWAAGQNVKDWAQLGRRWLAPARKRK